MKTDNEYIPYGVEWKDELMKLPKIAIIALYRSLCLKEQERNESPSQLPANEITDEEIKQKIIDTIKRYDEFVPKHELEMLSKKAGISIDEYCRIAVAEKITYWLHSQSKATPRVSELNDIIDCIIKFDVDTTTYEAAGKYFEVIQRDLKAARDQISNATPQVTDNLQSLMDDIAEWSDKTFGEGQRNPAIAYHLKKEVDELIESFGKPYYINMRLEFADCMMLLVDSAFHIGFTANDLLNAMREKLEINKKRKWGSPDKNGIIEHV